MSRSAMNIELQLTLQEADQALTAFHEKWKEKFKLAPTVEGMGAAPPGATAPTKTFGGLAATGDPSSWRAVDPVAGKNLREPRVFGQPISQLSPDMQRAIAAADPTSAAWLAQQTAPALTPQQVRRAERMHQWGVRREEYERRQTILGEDRQERNESFADRQRIRDDDISRRQRVRDQNRQERDEGWLDRDRNRSENQERRTRIAQETRQHRDESSVDRETYRQERRTFQADISGMRPRERAAAIEARMAGVDPESAEFEQLRLQRNRLQPQLGLNRTLIPNHMYMQMMFGAYDVASTLQSLHSSQAKSLTADTVQEMLQTRTQGIAGGGGIFSSIVKELWNVAGMGISALPTPAKLEEQVAIEGKRTELLDKVRTQQVAAQAGLVLRSAHGGTIQGERQKIQAQYLVDYGVADQAVQNASAILRETTTDQPGLVAARQSALKSAIAAKDELGKMANYQFGELAIKRAEGLTISGAQGDIFGLVASGASSSRVARATLSARQAAERRADLRENDNEILNAGDIRRQQELAAFDYTTGNQQRAEGILGVGQMRASIYQGKNMPYEAGMAMATARGRAGMLTADGPMMKMMAAGQMAIDISSLTGEFLRNTSTRNLANTSETAAINAMIAGDPITAIKERMNGRLNIELANMPQGPFRFFTEAATRQRFAAEERLQVKQVNDQQYLQIRQISDTREETGLQAEGKDKTATARGIANAALLAADAFKLVGRQDLSKMVLETGENQLQAYRRQLRREQYTEGSAVEVATGTFGARGSSTMPKELEPELIEKGLESVKSAVDEVRTAINNLATD